MAPEIEEFDAARYLKSPEAIAVFLADMFEHGDATMIAGAIGVAARAHGMVDLAKATGIPRATLYRVLSNTGNPTLDQFTRILDALGLALSISVKMDAASAESLIG